MPECVTDRPTCERVIPDEEGTEIRGRESTPPSPAPRERVIPDEEGTEISDSSPDSASRSSGERVIPDEEGAEMLSSRRRLIGSPVNE